MQLRRLVITALVGCAAPPEQATEVAQASHGGHGERCDWTQWGRDATHSMRGCAAGQSLGADLARATIDPFVDQEVAEFGQGPDGPLVIHYQVPLVDGDDLYVMRKAGTYTSCDPPGSGEPFPCGRDQFASQIWTERAYRWRHGHLEERWTFESDWKPPQIAVEAQFQPALAGRFLYVPGAGGSVLKVERERGRLVKRIRPFAAALETNTYVWGGIAADRDDNIYFNAVAIDTSLPGSDVIGAWLVRIDRHDRVQKVDYTTLIPTAPAPTDLCTKTFAQSVPRPARPWPPPPQPDGSPTLPDQAPCGSQAPQLNLTPAIGRDGTIFTATRAQLAFTGASFVIALRPDLTLAWAASLTGLLNDGCGVLARVCRAGATPGVDPDTNQPPAARVVDASSSTPVALPDGGVAYGAYTGYNGSRGHLMKFDRHGQFVGSFDFGWDSTPGLYEHDGTYSLITKNNYYFDDHYELTQVGADMVEEWSYVANNPLTCERRPDGTIDCHDDGFHPNGFEWCVNAPVVDRDGTIFGTGGDGWFYAIEQGGVERERHFLDKTRAASYTPAAIDRRGRLYGMNNGELFVLGTDHD